MWETLSSLVLIISYTITVTAVILLCQRRTISHLFHFDTSSRFVILLLISLWVHHLYLNTGFLTFFSKLISLPVVNTKYLFCPSYSYLHSLPGTPLSDVKWSWISVKKNSCWELGGLNLITSCWSNHLPTCKMEVMVVPCSQNIEYRHNNSNDLNTSGNVLKYIMLQKCRLSVFRQPSGLNLIVSWENAK